MMDPVIFLDIDGCLNNHRANPNGYCGTRWQNVQHLNHILEVIPAKLVISSAWRYLITARSMTIIGFEQLLLSHGVSCYNKVLGQTCEDEVIPSRGLQIQHWLNQHGRDRAYVIIDDGGRDPSGSFCDMEINTYHPANVVWIEGHRGLTKAKANRVIKKFLEQGEIHSCPSVPSQPH